ncbi:hypothetical protein L3X38_017148 [Prunus dulcis]|uniref:Integrase catalytic domain-containing protein n=1 Tax=Prunus dulcis TaxID=3755 RepID=A0AAD4W982_PRUDU|nr:hypothetical protein L3X38_017148 [Prunus dulcis]
MRTPWPFHTWGLDLIGTIHPPYDDYIWILTATKYFTKWVKAIPLRKAMGAAISNFIREYIVCKFGIPYKKVTDNGTPFVNKQVSSTLSGYGIKHRRSTPFYPQGNSQAEATNKIILRILSKMVYEYEGGWSVHLLDALWAYRTSPRSATCYSRYSLVTVKPQTFKRGDPVLKVVEHVRRLVSGPSKFAPQWEGMFAVKEVHSSSYYRLIPVKEGMLMDPINGKWLKPYYY